MNNCMAVARSSGAKTMNAVGSVELSTKNWLCDVLYGEKTLDVIHRKLCSTVANSKQPNTTIRNATTSEDFDVLYPMVSLLKNVRENIGYV